jgi:GGDEF domain-containing protein
MSLHGPIVVIANERDGALARALDSAGLSPIIDALWARAPGVLERVVPSAVVVTQAAPTADQRMMENVAQAIAGSPLYTPVLARMGIGVLERMPEALPIAADASGESVVARLRAALRVRALHASVTDQARLLTGAAGPAPPDLPEGDPIEEATVLVAGRGRFYPGLTMAVGERVGVIGALSVETAASYLNARDVDGVVIGEGFGPAMLAAFLTALVEDARFRDLPVALLPEPPPAIDFSPLANLERLAGTPHEVVAGLLPLVRQHAFTARLQRQLVSIKADGLIDSRTGLFTTAGFLADLARAIEEEQGRAAGLSLARFSFSPALDRRVSLDVARLISRLVRNIDFGCQTNDGSILVAFSATALRHAHVFARRIASVLRHTMLAPVGDPGGQVDASVTLATLKATDTVESLVARVSEPEPVALA